MYFEQRIIAQKPKKMKRNRIQLIIVVLLAGTFGFFLGRLYAHRLALLQTLSAEDTKFISLDRNVNRQDMTPKVDAPPLTLEDSSQLVEESEILETPVNSLPVKDIPEAKKKEATSSFLPAVNSGISDQKISEVLMSISKNMEAQKLEYIIPKGQDCSGIYHRLKDSLQQRLPALRSGLEYVYPLYQKDRSSRQIADWYYRKGNFLIVEDPMQARNSIRPGSVMFFGKSGKHYEGMTIEQLTDRDNNYTPNGFIGHVAVVVDIRTDEKNNVTEYTMMHARRPGEPIRYASMSGSKEVQSRNHDLPKFGHWKQQWVGIANMVTRN